MVISSNIQGCCASTNLYNLGGAHGHNTPATQEDFELQLRNLGGFSSATVAITNPKQDKVRHYLETCGFQTFKSGPRLQVHTIYGPDLTAYLQKRADHLKKYQDDKRNKRQESRAKFATAEGQPDPAVGVRRNGIFPGTVRLDRVLRLRPRNFDRFSAHDVAVWRHNINAYYNVNIQLLTPEAAWIRVIRERVYRAVHRQRQLAGLN